MFRACGGRCQACGRPFANLSEAFVDHDHAFKNIRGLVHPVCNFLIGQKEADPERWKLIEQYLVGVGKPTVP